MRLADLACTFAVAADVGMGMPMDHGLRSAAVAVRLGELAKAGDDERVDSYYLALFRYVGCTSDSDLASDVMGDEVSVRGELYGVDWGAPREFVPRMVRAVSRGKGRLRGAASVMKTFATMPKLLNSALSHCEVGDRLAERVGFGETFRTALFQTFERWDGRGWPRGVKQDAIALSMRLAQAAEEIEIGHRAGGNAGAAARAKLRSGKTIDPRIVEIFRAHATEICAPLEETSPWRAALGAEPSRHRQIDDAETDEVLLAMADFADLKSRRSSR
jgi:hypothetical protein